MTKPAKRTRGRGHARTDAPPDRDRHPEAKPDGQNGDLTADEWWNRCEEVWEMVASGMSFREVSRQTGRHHETVRRMYLRYRRLVSRVAPAIERREEHRAALRQAYRRAVAEYQAAGEARVREVHTRRGKKIEVERPIHPRDRIRLRLAAVKRMEEIAHKMALLDGFGTPLLGVSIYPPGAGAAAPSPPSRQLSPAEATSVREHARRLRNLVEGEAVEVEVTEEDVADVQEGGEDGGGDGAVEAAVREDPAGGGPREDASPG